MAVQISKVEYLKRYTSDPDHSKGKKRKQSKSKGLTSNIKVLDSDIKFRNDKNWDSDNDGNFELEEEKPAMFALDGSTIITKEYQAKELEKQLKWAPIRNNDTSPIRHGSSAYPKQDIKYKNSRQDALSLDLSPQRLQEHSSRDSVLLRSRSKRRRHDSSESDASPVRLKSARHDSSDSDLSPVRANDRKMSQFSVRERTTHGNDSDLSPPRKGKGASEDLSPPRTVKSHNWDQKLTRKAEDPAIISSGSKGGLKSAAELREVNAQRSRDERRKIDSLDAAVSGKGAETIYRDRKSGAKVDLQFEELKKRKLEEDKAKANEQFATWGKGVVQTSEYSDKLQSDVREMSKPLARHKDDADLDLMLKEQVRTGDPMLAYLTKKKEKVQKAERPRYRGLAPAPNRFNIWPGYRWDGVDRSNGFEKKRFAAMTNQQALEMEAFKWSTEDM